MVIQFLVFWGNSIVFPAFVFCRLFDHGHSDWCKVIPHCSFNLHFSKNKQYWTSFHVPVGHLYIVFGEMSDFSACFWLGFFFKLNSTSCLYILEINLLLVTLFANIFYRFSSHFVYGLLWGLIMFYFCFCFYSKRQSQKKILLWFIYQSMFCLFSSRSFIVSSLTFRPLINFVCFCIWC